MQCNLLRILPLLLLLSWSWPSLAETTSSTSEAFFEARIRPVLVEHCYECHSADAKTVGGELYLDSRNRLRAGGESGAAITPGDSANSLLMSALRYESYEMPPSGKLPARVLADFAHWIDAGAIDPRADLPAGDRTKHGMDIEAGRQFWAFQPPQRATLPGVRDSHWPLRGIDYFVLAKLESEGLQPSQPADRRVLIRRLSYDVLGLPPTREEVEAFQQDARPDAYDRLVERLLASPRFGERWARPWLDVARYAEDQAHIVGNNQSLFYPNAFLYRDWVIRALNADLPFDQFVQLQLAADLLAPDSHEHLPALGFLGLGPKYYRRNAPEVMADEWEDRVDTVSRGLLGLTVACARCHDHKYDPIPTEDYYGLAGVFASTKMFNRPLDPTADARKNAKDPAQAMHIVREHDQPHDIAVHIRGDAFKQGDEVPRRFLQVLSPSPQPLNHGSGRAELAQAIGCRENPLTARVMVNRVWKEYFGRGLVSTPSNFGALGERPTHPQLLDDLAARFMDSGWSLKWLHREILLSSTYRQSTSDTYRDRDPENLLLGRMTQRRMSLEQWRDTLLFVTDGLDNSLGGRSIEVSDPQSERRTLYAKVSRLELDSLMQRFDFPDPNTHSAKRVETTTPLQKLFVLNSPFMLARAEKLVDRIRREAEPTRASMVHRLYDILFSRPPSEDELAIATEFLTSDDQWPAYAQALLATNELMFID